MPFHGIRAPLGRDDLVTRCRAYKLRMRDDAAFTSLTAAVLWGMPVPAAADLSRLRVSVPHGRPRPRSRGVVGTERSLDVEVVESRGLRVLAPADAWASLASELGVGELIAIGDYLVDPRHGLPRTGIDALAAVAARRRPGAPSLRRALPRIRLGSRSRTESLVRVLLTESGVPEPSLNHPLPEAGVFLDLAWPAAKFGLEYQGGHHVSPEQHAADIRRQERVHDRGWLLMEITKFDLFDRPRAMVERVRSRLAERGIPSRAVHPPIWALPQR